jgi:hypothetical protein
MATTSEAGLEVERGENDGERQSGRRRHEVGRAKSGLTAGRRRRVHFVRWNTATASSPCDAT